MRTIVTVMLLALMAVSAQAASIWQGTTGDWSNAANWNGGEPFAGGGYTYINNAGTAQVTALGEVCARLYLGEGVSNSGTVDVSSGGALLVESFFFVGRGSGSGTVNVTGGGALTSGGPGLVGNQTAASVGIVTVDGVGSTWTSNDDLSIGEAGQGTLNVKNAGQVIASTEDLYLGRNSGSSGTLNVNDGGVISTKTCNVGLSTSSVGTVLVDGTDSVWANTSSLFVGRSGSGTLTITNGGLVSVANTLTIDSDLDGDGFVNMSTGGMLALNGEASDLGGFLTLVAGTDAIRYWDGSAWDDIANASAGADYTITAGTGDLAGYSVLTMVPEPATMGLMGLGVALGLFRRSKK